jgi:predicted nucleotidyltransferase
MNPRESILNQLRAKKAECSQYGIKSIGLFGSYARNQHKSGSDIDILIDFESGQETFDNFMAVYDILEAQFSEYKIEVVTKNGLSAYIGPKILDEVQYA